MTKKQFKEKVKEGYDRNRFHYLKAIREYTNCGLVRCKEQLVEHTFWLLGFNKDFETLWNLLTKEEKHYLRYKIQVL